MATNEWAHAALCTLFNVADDTSAVNKALIPELKVSALVGCGSCLHDSARCRIMAG